MSKGPRGSSTHIVLESIARSNDILRTHIPYKGGTEVMQAMLMNDVDIALTTQMAVRPYIDDGRLIPIAVTGPSRAPAHPDVPTLGELGISGFDSFNWLTLFSRSQVPSSIRSKIADDVASVLQEESIQTRFANDMLLVSPKTSIAELERQLEEERDMWRRHIQTSGVTLQ